MSEVKTPWKDYLGDVPMHLDYFQGSMFDAVARIAEQYPNNIAFDFMGKSTTYRKMVQEIERCAKSLKTLGVRPGDKVTIAGFGRFEMRERQTKNFTNPKTKVTSKLEPTAIPGFKASGRLKDKVAK